MKNDVKSTNHIAIAVNSLDEGIKIYKDTFGVEISKKLELPEHGVTTVFVKLSNTNIELLEPLAKFPISIFIKIHPVECIIYVMKLKTSKKA